MFGVAVACLFVPYIRKIAEWFVTIIHELGHGISALLLGGGIRGIKLHADGSGLTETSHNLNIFFRLVNRIVLLMGYAFPVYLGIALLIAAMGDLIDLGVWVLIGMGVLTLIFIRNLFGLLIVAIYFLTVFGVLIMHLHVDTVFLLLFMGMLFTVRGIYDIIMVAKMVFLGTSEGASDFDLLAETSWFPAQVWYVIFILLHSFVIFWALSNLNISIVFV